MIVMILEKVPPALRGELTRWLIEPHAGIFVGHVNAMVRDRLWEKCSTARQTGGVLQIWSTNNEQRFSMRAMGATQRQVIDMEGLQMVLTPHQPGKEHPRWKRTSGAPPDIGEEG